VRIILGSDNLLTVMVLMNNQSEKERSDNENQTT
jgi:hypothetical protein